MCAFDDSTCILKHKKYLCHCYVRLWKLQLVNLQKTKIQTKQKQEFVEDDKEFIKKDEA